MVVLSLSFGGLVFLSNYALSIGLLEEKIRAGGADLIVAGEYISPEDFVPGEGPCCISAPAGECELYIFHDLFVTARVNSGSYQLVEYMPELLKSLPPCDTAVYVLPDRPAAFPGPADIDIEGHCLSGIILNEAQAGFLRKLYAGGAVFIPHGSFEAGEQSMSMIRKYVLRILQADEQKIARWENMLTLLSRLDERNMTIVSSRPMLQELAQLKELQYYFRVAIVLGCSLVICLLLTSISSMEFRQNEYVYALMGSFGISRLCLFFTFVIENTLLVFGGFGISLLALAQTGPCLVDKLYRMENYIFSLNILRDDIHIFLTAFLISVPISCLPILGSICRPIGKILK